LHIFFKHRLSIEKLTKQLLNNYMNQPLHKAGPSLRQGEYGQHDSSSQPRYAPPTAYEEHIGTLEAPAGIQQSPEAQHMHHDSDNQYYGNANDLSQYHALSHVFGGDGNGLYDLQGSEASSRFAAGEDQGILRGIGNYIAHSGSGTQNRELAREGAPLPQLPHTSHMMAHRSVSVVTESSTSASMPSPPQFSTEHIVPLYEHATVRQTKYEPFQNRFHTSDEARDHRRVATRFSRMPYTDPESDDTISQIENSRQAHVLRIYNAMTSGENAKDNRGSIAMKRWVIEAHYQPDLVEAYAHKVFDCLLAQAKVGFRGWVHNDYVADERKGDDIDKDVDCAGRLDNIIAALEQEKTICEDVMNSACQIRMFVNAPRAYANRKHQNRVGNSKRGRTKAAPDPNPKPAKSQRTGGKRTRARSTTASDVPCSRGTTPQHQVQAQHTMPPHPYYTKASQHFTPSPAIANRLIPRMTSLHRPALSLPRHSFGRHSSAAMSQPTSSPHLPPHTPRIAATASVHLNSPFMSPPPPSLDQYSSPASSLDVKPQAFDGNWQNDIVYIQPGESPYPSAVDPVLAQFGLEQCEESNLDQFGRQMNGYVNLSDIEHTASDRRVSSSDSHSFQGFWDMQPGVQKFPEQRE
jgi:hypothetical protein